MATFLLLAAALASCRVASAAQLVVAGSRSTASDTPVARVVALIEELAAKVEADGKEEQQSYDKYACWCESTLARKAADISASKQTISDLANLIVKLKGEIATHGSEMEDLNKAIAANIESQKQASGVRASENAEYVEEKTESEQCIGALEAAIKVLTGAGAGKKNFLETMQEAQLLSIVAGVRGVLKRPAVARSVSDQDLQIVQRFVDRPEEFVRGNFAGSKSLSAVQIANNPFGDYAPQSTQIQGILKGMYDAFTGDLEKANAEEAEEQKSFEELMATKKAELTTLEATLERHTLDKAEKTKEEAQSQQARDDEEAQLEADEKFFDETKGACTTKAGEWNERARLRTEELHGMRKAVQVLSSPDAKATFGSSFTTLLQTTANVHRDAAKRRDAAWTRLSTLAKQYNSMNLLKVAMNLKTGGHFDAVITTIDQMIAILRKEEQDDIQHRDRCQGSQNKNKNDMEDLEHSISMVDKAIERMDEKASELESEIATLESEINSTKTDMAELLELRNEASAAFVQSLKDDTDAVALIEEAIVTLTKFYKSNKIPLSLARMGEPNYTKDEDKAPETVWEGADYGGRMSESGGIIAILSLIKEDLEMEMKTARSEDATAQKEYLAQNGAMKNDLDTQVTTKTAKEVELADVNAKINDKETFKSQEHADLEGEENTKAALYTDCSWVDTHFESRRTKRKTEITGLEDAKSYLAGVEAGEEV